MWSGPGTTRHIIPWTVMTGSNIPPASMSPAPRSSWIARKCFSGSGTRSTPAGAPGAAGWMPTSFSVKAIGRSPARRAWIKAPLGCSVLCGIKRMKKNICGKISKKHLHYPLFFWWYMRGRLPTSPQQDGGGSEHSAGSQAAVRGDFSTRERATNTCAAGGPGHPRPRSATGQAGRLSLRAAVSCCVGVLRRVWLSLDRSRKRARPPSIL